MLGFEDVLEELFLVARVSAIRRRDGVRAWERTIVSRVGGDEVSRFCGAHGVDVELSRRRRHENVVEVTLLRKFAVVHLGY